MKNLLTLRSMAYLVTDKQLNAVKQTQKFRDLIAVGKLLNAITYAHENGVSYQLAKLARTQTVTTETIYIKEGLIFEALELGQSLIDIYKDHPCVTEFDNLLHSFTDYKPPEVLIDMRYNGPFRLALVTKASEVIHSINVTGKGELFRELEENRRGIAIATIADADELMGDVKRGREIETHTNLESVIDCIVDDFTLAAEEFIFSISKELGLKTARPQPPAVELKLAA